MAILHDIDPIAIAVGPLKIHWYGLMYLAALGSAWWLGQRRVADGRYGVNGDQLSDLLFYGMIGVVLGGRVGYMLVYGWSELIANPLNLLRVWEGGMSFHGGLVGVMIACWLWSRHLKRSTIDTLDLNFQVQLTPQSNGVLLQADKPELDSIFMPKQGPFDSTSAHFGNAEVFILDLPNTQNLVYNLYLNPSANGADSMMLRYYPPPMGGWNQTTFFKGVR